MGYDPKYGRIRTEHKEIPDKEPLFLLRGQDELAPRIVRDYATAREKLGHSDAAKEIRAIAKAMEAWPKRKKPD